MPGVEIIDIIKPAFCNHRPCASPAFLGRLEKECEFSFEFIGMLCNIFRCAEADCRMAVMSAGMHHIRFAG
ncbi:Uncharacterised protein [Mycobacteroides abscessus subsp. abscessus]|nr:Uncharacterised protein [Mycobacteroides abscessus subsp. abscessus]